MKISVANITFSKNKLLREELNCYFSNVIYNEKFQRMDNEELTIFCNNSEVLILGLEKFNESLFIENPNLKIIAKFGVGIDNIDFDLLKKYKITLLHEIGVNKDEVAEFAYCQILSLLRNTSFTSNLLKRGLWVKDGGYSLEESTIGIIGVGNIGKAVLEKILNEECKQVYCYDIDKRKTDFFQNIENVSVCNLDELCAKSDLITIHIPGDKINDSFLCNDLINKMKKGVKLLNISRGSIVNYEDILLNISNGNIHSFCTDVFPHEPFFDSRFINNDRIFCTPHIAGNSAQSVYKMGKSVINSLKFFYNK
jgi:lactate dehydrogenase-like 2-hydroxyacid dehydrogenase